MKLTSFISSEDVAAHILSRDMTGRLVPAWENRDAWGLMPEEPRQAWIRAAERHIGADLPTLRASAFMAYFTEGSRTRYETIDAARRSALCTLLIAECLEGRERFVPDIVDLVWLLCEQTTWCSPAHHYLSRDPAQVLSNVEEPLFDLMAGETAATLAWTSFLLRGPLDRVSPLIRARIRLEIDRRIVTPYLDRSDFWWMGFGEREPNNWNPWCNGNLLAVALLQEMAPDRRAAVLSKLLRSLDRYLDVQHEDGGCDEGTTYWGRAAGMLLVNLELLYRASGGALQVYDQPLIRKLGQFVYRMYVGGPYFVNFADGAAMPAPDYGLIYLYGQRIKDDRLRALGQLGMVSYRVPSEGIVSVFQELIGLAAHADSRREEAPSPPLVQDGWLPDLQAMTAREREGSTRGLYLAAKGGHNDESHNHNDIGHYVVYADGRPYLIDIGVETYTAKTFSPERYEIWTMQSAYHSLPVVNGFGQKEGRDYRAGEAAYERSETTVRFGLDLAGAYPAEAGVKAWRRSWLFERAEGRAAAITLREQCELAEPSRAVRLHMISCRRPEDRARGANASA
ncbi:heparinase II/III domain-containing protein [Cohnella rhizosphaerae]|uniref:Heparinase II/III-family protein n=1 Tax=Cohnella rhizosphaerae TaxID=1457232 RepID=A0A9X4KRB6_9BACL|nr:heparinase II/III family protein [Cohnella rhizosphaerae]MDG0809460.1 heparinase II/III-family protein [Cohnella rhizosphaerae]